MAPQPRRSPLLVDPERRRRNNLTLLRLGLATLVLFSHSFPLVTGTNDREWASLLTRGQTTFGELAVAAFFALSGFLITQSWFQSTGATAYLRKRVLRIYPGFLVSWLISICILGACAAPSAREYFQALTHGAGRHLADALTLDMPHPPPTFVASAIPDAVNGSMWTIRYEFWCYLAVAAAGALGLLRRGFAVGAFAAIFASRLAVFAVDHLVGKIPSASVYLLGDMAEWRHLGLYFAAGVLLFFYADQVPRRRWLLAVALGMTVLTAATGVGLNAWLPIGGVYALFYLGFHRTVVPSWLVADGRDWSYGIYLYAFPIQQWLIWTHPGWSPYALFAVALVPTFAAAAVSWQCIEAPALRLKSRFADRRRGASLPALSQDVATVQPISSTGRAL
jgi:peptidoglycan/LPS O-acetylase OafA/YrhL